MLEILTFEPEKHEYRYDGFVIPSVTHITRFLGYDAAAGADQTARRMAAERGHRIHEACTLYDFEGDGAEVDADILGYVQAYAAFLRDYGIEEWELFETPMHSDPDLGPMFAGTLDRYGVIDGKKTLLDIKTGSALHMRQHAVQLAGYGLMCMYHRHDVEQAAVLHLKRDGTYAYRPITTESMCDAAIMFNECIEMDMYLKGDRK